MKIPFTKIELNLRKSDSKTVEITEELFKSLVETDAKFENVRSQMDPRETVGDSDVLIPLAPIPMDIVYDVADYSDTLRTIHQNLRKAIFKNGYEVLENFASKCNKCGKEYENATEECDECGGTDLKEPDVEQKKRLVRFLKNVNDNGQDIVKVSEDINNDLEVIDDGYMCCIKEYYHDSKGNLLGAVPVEILKMDARWVRLVADKTGRPGYNLNGDKVMFCPDHRNVVQYNRVTCKECGKELMPAHFRSQIPDGKYIYYGPGEVCHQSKYNPSLTYGFSVIYAAWNKIVTLMNMDMYMKNYYAKQRPPRGLLFVNTPNMDSLTKAWQWMTDEFKKNPHTIPPIGIEQVAGSKGNLVNFIDFMKSPEEMQFTEMRNEFRRQIGALYGVMPLFQADVSTSGGLNNEGLQITVTNEAIEDGQAAYNQDYYPWVCDQLGITDYHIELKPHEEQDEIHDEEIMSKKIDNAKKMQDIGFEVTLNEDKNFEFDPIDEPVEKPEQPGGFGFPGMGQGQGQEEGYEEEEPTPEETYEPEEMIEGKSLKKSKITYEEESKIILENSKKPENQKRHKFKPAEWTHKNGHPRCILCGEEESTSGYCEPSTNKADAPVTTNTQGVSNPVHGRRARYLKDYLRNVTREGSYGKEEVEMLEKADPEGLREFIEQSLYTRKFDGISKSISEKIKDFILRAVAKGYPKERVIKYMMRKADIPLSQAENIFRTENQALRTKTREWSYLKIDPEGKLKYKWLGPSDDRTTKICKNITSRTSKGVTMQQLKQVIKEEVEKAKGRGELPADFDPREYTPHFMCRHTFVRSYD